MKIIKGISVSLIVLSAVAALTSMTGVGEPQNYDPDKFALQCNPYNDIRLEDHHS